MGKLRLWELRYFPRSTGELGTQLDFPGSGPRALKHHRVAITSFPNAQPSLAPEHMKV